MTTAQMRTAGMSGIPHGIDLLAFARMSDALGYDTDLILTLMPFAETGMVKGYIKRQKEQ